MTDHAQTIWTPTSSIIAAAYVTKLAEAAGCADYDALLRHSLKRPDRYWEKALEFLRIAWARPPEAYVDLTRGPEFPRWFPGGDINWVDTVLAFADAPTSASRYAVVAEREDGSVSRVTYKELGEQVRKFAAGLLRQGVKRGDRIGLLTENGIEATISALAISYIGAIMVPLFSGFGTDAIVSRLQPSGATILIASTGFDRRGVRVDVSATLRAALGRLPEIRLVIWKTSDGEAAPSDGVEWRSVMAGGVSTLPASRMTPDDPFMIIYTSGTTGKPKGAVHSHGGFPPKIAHDAAVHFDVGEGDIFCWPADMGWIAGTLVLSAALLRGATLVCYDGAPDYPDWSRMSRLIERHRITHFGSAPTLIRGLAANAPLSIAGDMTSLELLITAGEGIDPEHFLWFQRHFGSGTCPLINYTGGTEVSGALLSSVVVRPIAPGGFNTASPAVAVEVVDSAGTPLVDSIGELSITAPFVGMTQSFWQDDDRYLESYWRTIPGIWVHGDLALRTADGHYFMRGRSDDTLKVAGKRLGPAEVEEILLELPDVNEAAAIGVDDPVKGQKLVVFLVPATAWDRDVQRLTKLVRDQVDLRLGKPFRPGAVHLVTQLPKTRSSKVMRRLIRSVYCNQPLGDLSALDNPAALDELRRALPA